MLRGFDFAFVALSSILAACGTPAASEFGATTGGGGVADTRYYPIGNGMPMMEAAACQQVQNAITDGAFKLGCVATVQQCPGMLRSIYEKECMQYDAGTVTACVAYFGKVTTCGELDPESCVLIGFPTTAPFGCPEK